MGWFSHLLRWARRSWPLIIVLVVSLMGAALWPVFARPPSDLGVQAKPKIRQLMYPTFGNPAIVKKGTSLTIEFDPRNRDFHKRFIKVDKFDVSVRTSNGVEPVRLDLPVESVEVGSSSRWPEYAKSTLHDRRIYLVKVSVPRFTPVDLYDLRVTGGSKTREVIDDYQPHALQAVDEFKDDFDFVQLTDIHVFGPECTFGSAVYHGRGDRQNGSDPKRLGAVYYQKAINQINLLKPAFCVFTGDYMFGQSYLLMDHGNPWGLTTEYEYEMTWFYNETMKLDVPVFMTLGNHDSFAEGDGGAHEDWFENWRRLFGPVYYSYDYGGYHFLSLNAQDWPRKDRELVDYDFAIQSEKYKGQFSGGGDKWAPGISAQRLAQIDESKLSGQLKWMRDDLAASKDAKMRIVATHQDPWRKAGSGQMWASAGSDSAGFLGALKSAFGFGGKYGDGAGRLAAIKLMEKYKVGLELSGHFHSDFLEVFPWPDGTGQLVSANTTCAQFNVDGISRSYPGYRLISIRNGKLASVNYMDPFWSYPLYAGTNVGGLTDLTKLETPALNGEMSDTSGNSTDVTLAIANSLAKPVKGAYAEFKMPYLDGHHFYKVLGGTIKQTRDSPNAGNGKGHRVYEVNFDVGAGEVKDVRVIINGYPDNIAPVGKVTIDGGALLTTSQEVTLDLDAADEGGSGLKDMMISNRDDFKGAVWEPYQPAVKWKLASGDPGTRTVFVKFRDYAMPGNVSDVAVATIQYITVDI